MNRKWIVILLAALLAALAAGPALAAETRTKAPYTFEILNEETKEVRIVGYNPNGRIPEEGIDLEIPAQLDEYTVTEIGDVAFKNQRKLRQVTVPEGVTAIGTRAFNGCDGMESIQLPDTLTSIGNRAFSNCKSLHAIELPAALTAIGENAFRMNTSGTAPFGKLEKLGGSGYSVRQNNTR